MALNGVYTAMVTPFSSNGEVDYGALKQLIQEQAHKGVSGFVPCGTTGESPTLSHAEHREVIANSVKWAKELRSDMAVIAGTGSNSTKEAVELTQAAAADGADYALVVNPYYNKPTQEGLRAHFTEIADKSSIPIVLYNIPGRTSVCLSIETVTELAAHENIVGIKEATGDLNYMTQVIESVPADFVLLSGDDNLLLPILAIGGKGVISVASNVYPELMVDMIHQFVNGNAEESKNIFYNMLPFMRAMFFETNPIPVKYALSLQKKVENVLRAPLTPLAEKFRKPLRDIMAALEGMEGNS